MQKNAHRILLLEDNEVNARLVAKMLEDTGDFQVFRAATLVEALDLLAYGTFDAALVDLGLPDSNGLETFLAIQRHAPHLAIVVLTGQESGSMASEAVALGAQDYLNKGYLNAAELIRTLQHGIIRNRRPDERPELRHGEVVGFLGCKGGVGVTTLACHAVGELMRRTGEPTLLLDSDARSSGAAFLMNTPAEYTLADAALNLHRLDSNYWKNLVSHTADGVDVLAPPGAAGFNRELDPDRVHHVLRFARALYGRAVVDLGTMNAVSLRLLEEVFALYVVTTEELPALREAGRLLGFLTQAGLPGVQVRLVLNRRKKRSLVTVHDLEKALGHEIYATVADVPDELTESFAAGRYIDTKSTVHKDTARLVSKHLGKEESRRAQPAFGFLRLNRAEVRG